MFTKISIQEYFSCLIFDFDQLYTFDFHQLYTFEFNFIKIFNWNPIISNRIPNLCMLDMFSYRVSKGFACIHGEQILCAFSQYYKINLDIICIK